MLWRKPRRVEDQKANNETEEQAEEREGAESGLPTRIRRLAPRFQQERLVGHSLVRLEAVVGAESEFVLDSVVGAAPCFILTEEPLA